MKITLYVNQHNQFDLSDKIFKLDSNATIGPWEPFEQGPRSKHADQFTSMLRLLYGWEKEFPDKKQELTVHTYSSEIVHRTLRHLASPYKGLERKLRPEEVEFWFDYPPTAGVRGYGIRKIEVKEDSDGSYDFASPIPGGFFDHVLEDLP